jgi:O-antigen/teichoic acid export membrane protein
MDFAQDFRFVFVKRLAGFAVTITAALVLRSYWALVIGSLAGRAVGVGLSYSMHPSRSRLSLEKFSDVFSVAQWMILRSIANYLNANMHKFLVGGRTTSAMVGGYSLAQQIASMPSTEVLAPLNRVLFPAFVKAKHDAQELKRVYLLAQGVQTLVVMPFSIGLAMLATEAVQLLLGEKWLFVAPFVQVLALSAIAQSISVSGSYVLLTLGEFAKQTLFTVAQVIVFLLGAYLLIPQGGAMEIALLRLATILLGLGFSVWLLLHKMDGVRLADIVRSVHRPLLASMAMSLAIHALALQLHTDVLASLLLKGALGAAVYLVVVTMLWGMAGRPCGSETYLLDKLQEWRAKGKK